MGGSRNGTPHKIDIKSNKNDIQASDRYTSIRQVYQHQTGIQASDILYDNPAYYTIILLLYNNPTTMQESYYYTRMLLLYKNPTTIQESYYYTRILLLYKNPTIV